MFLQKWDNLLGKFGGTVLTMNQLERRDFPFVSRCPLCEEREEDRHHLLIQCSKVWELWSGMLSCVDIAWACPYLARDLLIC